MRIEFYGLAFDTAQVSFILWSPWRAAELEHRLFKAVHELPGVQAEQLADEWRVHVRETRFWRVALSALERVLKGWQEEAEPGSESRSWRWLIDGDTDPSCYDHTGEPTSLWCIVRASLDRGGPGEADKGEDIDMEGFSIRICGPKLPNGG